jgi:hypothetical protein
VEFRSKVGVRHFDAATSPAAANRLRRLLGRRTNLAVASDDFPSETETETETEARAEETVMPWVWGGIGLFAVAAFIAWFVLWPALHPTRNPPAAAPTLKAGIAILLNGRTVLPFGGEREGGDPTG